MVASCCSWCAGQREPELTPNPHVGKLWDLIATLGAGHSDVRPSTDGLDALTSDVMTAHRSPAHTALAKQIEKSFSVRAPSPPPVKDKPQVRTPTREY